MKPKPKKLQVVRISKSVYLEAVKVIKSKTPPRWTLTDYLDAAVSLANKEMKNWDLKKL